MMNLKPLFFLTNRLKLLWFTFLLCLTACQPAPTPEIVPFQPDLPLSPITVKHPIQIRADSDGKEGFFNTETEQRFIPRGYNFAHVAVMESPCSLTGPVYHSTFNQGYYETLNPQALFAEMHALQYNTVRVFLNPECMLNPDGTMQETYLNNLTNFLKAANTYQIYVIITLDLVPSLFYGHQIDSIDAIIWANRQYLEPTYLAAEANFWQTLIHSLDQNKALLETILAYEIRNEFYFHPDSYPLDQESGSFTAANGKTYDLSQTAQKETMVQEGFLFWSKTIRDAIHAVDPTALVTSGFFAPEPYGKIAAAAMIQSELDFIDIHLYPEQEAAFAEYANYFSISETIKKALLLGEFGLLTDTTIPAQNRVQRLQDWMQVSCRYGFDGWLVWSWTTQSEIPLSLIDDGLIKQGLAPLNFPDVCDVE